MCEQNYPLIRLASIKQLIRPENSYEEDAIHRRQAGYCPGLGLLKRDTVFDGTLDMYLTKLHRSLRGG